MGNLLSNSASRKVVRLRSRSATSPRSRAWRDAKEWLAKNILLLAGSSSIFITLAIVCVLIIECRPFFAEASVSEFLTGTQWDPLAEEHPKYGILPLVSATLVSTVVALVVAIPIGTIVALYLSELAPFVLREILKPCLELLSAVPTVVYGYFALQVVSPLVQVLGPDMSRKNMLSAGLVMGIMIIPYVSSLSEDAMRSVPMLLREGSYALGANKTVTAWRVVVPSALSGIGAAYILGISRAIGETMIVAVAAGKTPNLTLDPRDTAQTITSFIVETATGDPQHGTAAYHSLFAAGLALFAMTLVFNILGYWLRRRFHQAY